MSDTKSHAHHQQVTDDLLALICKFAGVNLLQEIASGDSQAMKGDDAKHLAALHELRDRYDWRLVQQPQNGRHPCEPIKLIAYAVDDHSQPAQVFCNALLMVADLDGAQKDYMSYRWFDAPGESWYRNLNDPWKSALLAGFALLHANTCEMDRGFWDTPDAKGRWIEPAGGWDE